MAITRTNLRMTDTAVITPLDRGATGDNVADDTTFIQAAIDDTSYSIVDLQGKTYRITTALTCNHNNKTIRNGTIRLDSATPQNYALKIVGAEDATAYALAADANIGDNYVDIGEGNLTASGIVAGDWVYLRTPNNVTAFSSTYQPEDMLKVWYTTSEGKVYFTEGLAFKYRTSEGSTISKGTTVYDNIRLERLTFVGSGVDRSELGSNPLTPQSTGSSPVTVQVTHSAHNLENNEKIYIANTATGSGITDSSISGKSGFDISNVTTNTYDVSITDTGGADSTDAFGGDAIVVYSGGDRGVQVQYASNVVVENCTFKDFGEYVSLFYYTHNVTISNCCYEGPTQPYNHGIHLTTQGGRHYKIINNVFTGSANAVRVGATKGSVYALVDNNIIEGINWVGVRIFPTSVRSKVTNNIIRCTDWQTRPNTSYNSIGIESYAPDFVCSNNRIEGATNYGIYYSASTKSASAFGGAISSNADAATEFPSQGHPQIVDNTIYAPRTTTWAAFNPTSDFYGIRIQDLMDGTNSSSLEGTRILGNYIHGYSQGINFNVASKSNTTGSGCGFKDVIVSSNIVISTPKAGFSKGAYGLGVENNHSGTQNMKMKRIILSNNIFDVRGADTDALNDAPIVGLYDSDQSHNVEWTQSVFSDNVMSFSYGGAVPHVKFSTSQSDAVRYPNRSTFIGNVMVGDNTQTAVQSVLVYDAGVVSMPGKPVSAFAGEHGQSYGLNAFSNITNSGWAGTP